MLIFFYSSIANHTTGEKCVWLPECQAAFEEVKQKLCSAPVLVAPQLGLPFHLQTDASNDGAGAVLMQADDNGV